MKEYFIFMLKLSIISILLLIVLFIIYYSHYLIIVNTDVFIYCVFSLAYLICFCLGYLIALLIEN